MKAPKESQSDKVACYEVATFWTEAFDKEDRFAERVIKVVLFFCLGLFDCHWANTYRIWKPVFPFSNGKDVLAVEISGRFRL